MALQRSHPPHESFEQAKREVRSSENLSTRFGRIAASTARAVGTPWMFLLACASVVVWGLFGPVFHYSDTWQLVINTSTTIITFLIVFLIQNTQNRDAKAIHLKLDEVIRSIHQAKNEMIDIEKLSDEELTELKSRYEMIRQRWETRQSTEAA